MSKKVRMICLSAIFFSIIITSCATTTLLNVWKDDNYTGNIKKVLVIGTAEKQGVRRIFEREFVSQFKTYGIEAVPSYEYIPADKVLDKNAIISKINELDIDSVLITALVGKKTVERYIENWYSYHSGVYSHLAKDEIVHLETNVYDAGTEKLIWTALSETILMEEESAYGKIKPFVKTMLNKMSEGKIFQISQ